MRRPVVFSVLLFVQLFCAGFFLFRTLSALLGLPPISWRLVELIEISAGVGLTIGVILASVLLRRSMERTQVVEGQLRAASGAFNELLEEHFVQWGLTPAERDVALFTIKGLSSADIAAMRQTSEGTVKAQTSAIYRKAGVSGRSQLLSLFIDELMGGPLTPSAKAAE